MANAVDALRKCADQLRVLGSTSTGLQVAEIATEACKAIREANWPDSDLQKSSFQGLSAALSDLAADLPEGSRLCAQGLIFAAETLAAAVQAGSASLKVGLGSELLSRQLAEPSEPGALTTSSVELTRLQCVEILAAGFFGLVSRSYFGEWRKRGVDEDPLDMSIFCFLKLWAYDCGKWNTKNFVLMGVLLYFYQASLLGNETLQVEKLTITRKAIGPNVAPDEHTIFCPFDLQQDGVSIHDFPDAAQHLQADFANEYLGGGVMSGGGSQEESMFVDFTELLATLLVVERMRPFEAVEIHGPKKFVEQNMMAARHLHKKDQFCRPVAEVGGPITTVAFDALCFNSHGTVTKWDQYKPPQLQRELRKCQAALGLPDAVVPSGTRRSFVSGNWGCGAFRGDLELKCVLQWISCSMEPSMTGLVYCPFDQHRQLTKAGLTKLVERLQGKAAVRTVLELLLRDDFQRASSTFAYLLEKLDAIDCGR